MRACVWCGVSLLQNDVEKSRCCCLTFENVMVIPKSDTNPLKNADMKTAEHLLKCLKNCSFFIFIFLVSNPTLSWVKFCIRVKNINFFCFF